MATVKSGMIWSFIERLSTQGVAFVVSVVIARLVAPEIYGLLALVQVFISFAQVFIDSGFGNALIQKHNRTEVDYYTVFIFNLVVSVALYCLFFFCAPLISNFYNEPDLTLITRLISLTLFISSFSIVQRTKLTIQLDFKTQAISSLLATIISGVIGIIMAYKGYEVWALVAQQLILQTVQVVVLSLLSRWKPKLIFSYKSFKSMFSFGSKLLVNNIITSIYINIANLVIGKTYSPASLAYYNRGFNLSQILSVNIEGILQRIIYPIICDAQDNRDRMIFLYHKYLHFSHFIIWPLMTMLCVLATPLVSVLFTDKWLPAADYVVLFSLNFMVYAWADQSGGLTNAIGRSDMNLIGTFIKRPIAFILLFISLGISVKAVCIATIVTSVIELLVNIIICNKAVKMSFWDHIKPQLDLFFINLLLGILIFNVSKLFDASILKLFVCGLIGIILYLLLIFMFKIEERKILMNVFKSLFNR